MLGEVVDAVVGVDTHRDVHEAELAAPTSGSAVMRRASRNLCAAVRTFGSRPAS